MKSVQYDSSGFMTLQQHYYWNVFIWHCGYKQALHCRLFVHYWMLYQTGECSAFVNMFCWRLNWWQLMTQYDTRKQHSLTTHRVEICWVPLFKWTNQPPDQFTLAEEKVITFGVGREDRGTVVFFNRRDQSKFPSICLQPNVADNDIFTEVMRLFRQRKCTWGRAQIWISLDYKVDLL